MSLRVYKRTLRKQLAGRTYVFDTLCEEQRGMPAYEELPGFTGTGGFLLVKELLLSHICNSDSHGCYVLHPLHMTGCNTVISIKSRTTYGTHFLDHRGLAEVAGFAGGQVAAPAVLEVDTNLIGV